MERILTNKKYIVRIIGFVLIIILSTTAVTVNAEYSADYNAAEYGVDYHDMENETNITENGSDENNETVTDEALEDELSDEHSVESPTDSAVTNEAIETINPLTATSESSVTVSTFAELKKLMEDGTNGYTVFYLSADIEATGGINVASVKKTITLSGRDPVTGQIHKYKELPSLAQSQTIIVSVGTSITIQDMIIDGYNYYGTTGAYDGVQNVYIKYDGVEYNGPQPGYNLNGTVHIKDSQITIPQSTKPGGAPNQEVAQASKVILDGKTDIRKTGGGDATFWIYSRSGTPEIKVLSNAHVTINSITYFIYHSGGTEINIEEGGVLNANINGGITYLGQVLGSINVGSNGTFKYTHNGTNGNLRSVILSGNLTVGDSATFDVRRTQSSYNGTANARILLSMESASSRIELNNPMRFILVNAMNTTDGLIRFSAGGTLNINTKVMNMWKTMPSGFVSDINWNDPLGNWEKDQLPSNVWNQKDFENINLKATYVSSSPVVPSTINLTEKYVPATPDNTDTIVPSSFLNTSSKMFTAGYGSLEFDDIYDGEKNISGNSTAGSYVGIFSGNENNISGSAVTDSDGKFLITLADGLPGGSVVYGASQYNFLRSYALATVISDDGVLKFYEVPSTLDFKTNYTPDAAVTIGRQNTDWSIQVMDTRKSSNDWAVYGSIESPLTASHGGSEYTLPDSLIYKNGSSTQVFSSEPILIRQGVTDTDSENGITAINWAENEGPLIQINDSDNVLSNTNYTAKIKWTLVNGPQ